MDYIKRKIVKLFVFLLNYNIYTPGIFYIVFDKIVWSNKDYLEEFLTNMHPGVLENLAQKKVLYVFRKAVETTPAYKDFLVSRGIDYTKINSIEAFNNEVPETNKENYVKAYPLEMRCVGGRLPKDGIIFRSAGVGGNPTYWTQALKEEDKFEVFVPFGIDYIIGYKNKNFKILNCWAFGIWPTAIDFTKSARSCGQMINIGTDINELIATLKILGNKHNYLISGYPPFLRNMIFEGERQGINWSEYKVDIVTGGEGFVEEWRDFLRSRLGKKSIIASSYGSTDKGLAEGFETPLTIVLRNLLRINQVFLYDENRAKQIAQDLFEGVDVVPKNKDLAVNFLSLTLGRDPEIEKRLPMLFQGVPITYYEQQIQEKNVNGISRTELLTTVLKTHASQPIIKYNIKDDCGVISHTKLMNTARKFNYDLTKILTNLGHDINKILPLPFMYVYGRSDGTVSIDGANIFPEEIGRLIENLKELSNMIVSFQLGVSRDYRFLIQLELKKDCENPYSTDDIKRMIETHLCHYSSGYKILVDGNFKSANLVVELFKFAEGPFEKSPLINKGAIKYQYIGKKIFGR